MAYTPHTWADNVSDVTAARLNNMETGIDQAHDAFLHYICLRDEKANGTDGGGMPAATWSKRALTEFSDVSGLCSVSSSVITLAAGTYRCRIAAPAFHVGRHKLRLRNTTAGVTLLAGVNAYSPAPTAETNPVSLATLVGRFTVAAAQSLEVQHNAELAKSINGFGVACSMGEVEVYTVAEFWKEV